MDLTTEFEEIDRRLKAANLPLAQFLAAVGVHETTWYRWKARQTVPRLDRWRRVQYALPPEGA